MNDASNVVESQECEEIPEEVVETSFMCGICFLFFPTTEEFNTHHCQVDNAENVSSEGSKDQEPTISTLDVSQSTDCVQIAGVWEAGESEAAMEEAVASILGERMKRTAPKRLTTSEVQFDHSLEAGGSSMKLSKTTQHHLEPILEHTVEDGDHIDSGMQMEGVEIPTTNLYMYDNPVYLNRLMKDNTFGRRVRHDAPYSHRLGPWDNKSSRLLIQLLSEHPRAYFILDKECKRTEAWEMIRIKLAEAGYQFTVLQIRMRWRELCKKYRNTVNHNDLYNSRKTCQFFDDLNALFGVWDHPATLLLIRQLEANGGKPLGQNGGTRMRIKVWEHIRQVLASHGYQYTPDQVQGRWSNLVTLYQRMVEHNSKAHNEPITIAFKDHIERIFNYVPERNSKWLKIMEKRGKTPKSLSKKWSLSMERKLLTCYYERVYRFNNEHVDNSMLWEEIVQKLEEAGYTTSVEKVRTRFYELTKLFSTTELHNSQPGTIRRECKHHELLSEIYSIYNFWPHDRSTIKLEKSNTIRMRQVNAQLMWSEDESRTLLQLYPKILVAHLTGGDHQPMEELWLQLAKAYMNAISDRKQCYEIEEHITLLRRGYRSHNPFPFVAEMQLLEETEAALGFSQDALSIASDQLIPYWSHRAAHLLLDLVMHHRQEGVKNSALFELISRDLAGYGYRYTGEECRVYYSLLRQLYTNRMRTIKRKKELAKPFPYMDKMTEVDTVVSQPRFIETVENRVEVLRAACSKLDELKNEDSESQKDQLLAWLTNLKMFFKRNTTIHPPPSVRCLARILSEALEDPLLDANISERCSSLGPYIDVLKSISERGGSGIDLNSSAFRGAAKKITKSKIVKPKYGSIQWTEKNLHSMLETIKEWKLLCHDNAEVELMLGIGQPLWKEVASRLSGHYKVDPNKCQERFSQLCREYKSVVSFNARLGPAEGTKSVMCQDSLESVFSLLLFHDAELDTRDQWWASDECGNWSQNETIDLIFTVREVWSELPQVDWSLVSMLMAGSGHQHCAESCQEKFQHLYSGYQTALEHNRFCGLRTRRRPPFYYKLKSLFNDSGTNFYIAAESTGQRETDVDKPEILQVLVAKLKKIKIHHCHSVPRRPLLLSLAQHLNEHFLCSPPVFDSFKVWELLVHLHHVHRTAAEKSIEVPDEVNLQELWQNDPNPLKAYGLHSLPIPAWQQVCQWEIEEIYLLIEAVINWELQQQSLEHTGKNIETVASELLKAHGYDKTTKQCQDQWHYVVITFKRGGYRQFADQMNLIYMLAPTLLTPNINCLNSCMLPVKTYPQQHDSSSKIQVAAVHSLPEQNDQNVNQISKKLKKEKKDMAVLTISEEDLEKNNIKTNAPGNVVSYVQINVQQNSNQAKRHVQVSTDELRDESETGTALCYTVKEDSDSTGRHNVATISPLSKIPPKSSFSRRQKSGIGKSKNKRIGLVSTRTKTPAVKSKVRKKDSVFQNSEKPPGDKVQVEVFSIVETESAKVVECRTTPNVTPVRTIKLHYPPDHPLPSGFKNMYIPRAMVYPDVGSTTPVLVSELSDSFNKNQLCLSPFPPTFPSVLNIEESQESIRNKVDSNETEEGMESNASANLSIEKGNCPQRGSIIKLLGEYSQHCEQENRRLFTMLQESHLQQTSCMKQILSLFQELKKLA